MPTATINLALPGPFYQSFSYQAPQGPTPVLGSRVVAPFGPREHIGIVTGFDTPDGDYALKPALNTLDQQSLFNDDIWAMCLWAAKYYQHALGNVFAAALPKLLRDGHPAALKMESIWELSDLGKGLGEDSLKRAPKQKQCIALLRSHGGLTSADLKLHGIANTAIKALKEKAYIQQSEKLPELAAPQATDTVTLNEQQQDAYETIKLHYHHAATFLLYGITGSGKTEVYLEAVKDVLAAGKQVLIILPEINLTPQFVTRFERRLGQSVAALHSNQTDRQRLNHWLNTKMGRLNVIVGTRSAIFTPFADLGLIIVDEEHANTLKQQEGFKYSARDCAVWRSHKLGIPCILGSATPSIESYAKAETGRYIRLDLTTRANAKPPPQWQFIDIRNQALHHGVSEEVLQRASLALHRNEQVMFFINRLGFAPTLQCHHCGWHAQCSRCDSNLRVFLQKRQLRCGHCDYTQSLPYSCPECGTTPLQTTGQGSEQVDDFLTKYYQDYPVIRLDSETTQSKRKLEAKLAQINQGDACVIVGTQMMAKGHDFAKLSLVVILNSDDGINSGHFRGVEETAQLLTQVAGRAGRGETAGNVLVQSYCPEHPLFDVLASNHYESFLEHELQQRRTLGLPPQSFEALILVTAKHPDAAQKHLQHLVNFYQWQCLCLGPQPAVLARKAGWFRSTLIVRADSRKVLHQHLDAAKQWLLDNKSGNIRWSIDVDPLEQP